MGRCTFRSVRFNFEPACCLDCPNAPELSQPTDPGATGLQTRSPELPESTDLSNLWTARAGTDDGRPTVRCHWGPQFFRGQRYIEELTDPQGFKVLIERPCKHPSCFWA